MLLELLGNARSGHRSSTEKVPLILVGQYRSFNVPFPFRKEGIIVFLLIQIKTYGEIKGEANCGSRLSSNYVIFIALTRLGMVLSDGWDMVSVFYV